MRAVSDEALALFKNKAKQTVRITVTPVVGDSFTLSEADILAGGFKLNRSSVSGNTIEIGSVIASDLSLMLENYDGRFSTASFEGATLFVSVGVADGTSKYSVPFGYFIVDEVSKSKNVVVISALDRMIKFDKEVSENFFNDSTDDTFDIVDENSNSIYINGDTKLVWKIFSSDKTIGELVKNICYDCGVRLKTDLSKLPNNNYSINSIPFSDSLTYRQLLSWCCQIMGVCAFLDSDGMLVLKWYTESNVKITLADRYDCTIDENSIKISKLILNISDNTYTSGNGDYAIDLTGNMLIQINPQTILNTLYSSLGGFTYIPFTAETVPLPQLEPLDKISVMSKDGKTHSTVITNCTFSLNGTMTVAGQGVSETEKNYSALNAFTPAQAFVIEQTKQKISDFDSKIEQTRESILLEVSGTYATSEAVSSSLQLLGNEINSKVSSSELEEEVSSQITQTAKTIRLKASEIVWSSKKSSMTAEGVLTASGANITGEITAESGIIGGFTLKKARMQYGDMNDGEERFWIWPGGSADTIGVANKARSGWQLVIGSNFGILKGGSLFATDVTITGNITAKEGKIGGFSTNETRMYKFLPEEMTDNKWVPTASSFLINPNNQSSDVWTVAGKDVSRPALLLGKNFCVTTEGYIYASKANISGKIIATSLELNGCSVNVSDVSAPNGGSLEEDLYDDEGKLNFVIKNGKIGTASFGEGNNGTAFKVSTDGLLQAQNAVIYGTIYASNGKIGGFTLSTNKLSTEDDGVVLSPVAQTVKVSAMMNGTTTQVNVSDVYFKANEVIIQGNAITSPSIAADSAMLTSVIFTQISGYDVYSQKFYTLGNTTDLQTQINSLYFSAGDTITVPVNTSFSGYVPYGKKGIHFLIPLSKPATATTANISGKILARGANGALNGGSNYDLGNLGENNTISTEIISGVGIRVMLSFNSEISGAVNNDVVSVGTREALTITFA